MKGARALVRLLVVEDDDIDAKEIMRVLSKPEGIRINFEIKRVKFLKEALLEIPKGNIDLILLDFNLPDSLGMGTLKKVLKIAKRIPVVILTGSDDQHLAMTGIKLGAQDFIFKGDLNKEKLVVSIWNSIERTQLKNLKDDFISTVSHELKTPLTGIRNVISNALDGIYGSLEEKLKKSLEIANDDIIRLTSIINDLLDVSRFDSSNMKFEGAFYKVEELFEQALHTLKKMAQDKNISIELKLEKVHSVYCDKNKFIQIVINLVNNAIKFTKDGGKILIRSLNIDPDYVCFCISDTGIGIPDLDKERIFQRFVQIDNSYGPGAKGTGLGLAIVKELIELHEGRIWVEDNHPQGSEFFFTIPKKTEKEATRG